MFKKLTLGLVAVILAVSGFNGYAFLTQVYPDCEVSIFSESETAHEPSGNTTESESGGIGGLIGGLMPGGGGDEGGGGIGGLIGGGGGIMPGGGGGIMPGGWIFPHLAYGQVTEEQEEFAETILSDALENEEMQQDRLDAAGNIGTGENLANVACETASTMKLGTLGLSVAGLAGIVFNFILPIIRKVKSGSGNLGNLGDSSGSGGYTGSIKDINTIIEAAQEEVGKGLKISVKFQNTKKNPLFQVNYDITAKFGNHIVLEEKDVHSANGELIHSTIDIPDEMSDQSGIIQVTFKGFGIKSPFSGPVGEIVSKTISNTGHDKRETEQAEILEKKLIPKINLKLIIPLVIAGIFPIIMMAGVIPIQADETTASIAEIEEPQVTIAELENKMNVLESHVQNIADSINLEVPGKHGEKGSIGSRGIVGEPGEDGGPGEMFSILSFSSGGKKIRVSGAMYLGENESFPNYHAAKTFIPFEGDLSNLVVSMDNAPAILVNATLIKNDIPTTLSCQLEKNTQCTNTENKIPIEIGDTFSLRLSENDHGESDSFVVQASMVIEIP